MTLSGDTPTGPKLNSRSYLMSRKCALGLVISLHWTEGEGSGGCCCWFNHQMDQAATLPLDIQVGQSLRQILVVCLLSDSEGPSFFFLFYFLLFFLLYPIFVSFSLFSGVIASAVAGRTSIRPRKLDARECTSFMARPCVTCTQLDTETLGQLRLPLEADSFPLEHGSFCAVCASLAVSM